VEIRKGGKKTFLHEIRLIHPSSLSKRKEKKRGRGRMPSAHKYSTAGKRWSECFYRSLKCCQKEIKKEKKGGEDLARFPSRKVFCREEGKFEITLRRKGGGTSL